MRHRGLLTLAIGLAAGLSGGLVLHRAEPHQQAAETARPDEGLAQEVRALRAEVRSLRQSVAARPEMPVVAQAPQHPPEAPEPHPAAAEAPAAPSAAEQDALDAAHRIVDGARSAGAWTPSDRQRLHALASSMRPEDLAAVLKKLAVEINSQRVHLSAQAGPVF